ncbi:MAG: NucA/NucB deoxyribonuclease domain-containing protein [Terriglobia bacterium]
MNVDDRQPLRNALERRDGQVFPTSEVSRLRRGPLSAVAVCSPGGTRYAARDYNAFGETLAESGVWEDAMDIRYQGNWQDVLFKRPTASGRGLSGGMNQSPTQVYDQETGRFLQRDPAPEASRVAKSARGRALGQWQGTGLEGDILRCEDNKANNAYAYCDSDPVNKVDATGMAFDSVTAWVRAHPGQAAAFSGTAFAYVLGAGEATLPAANKPSACANNAINSFRRTVSNVIDWATDLDEPGDEPDDPCIAILSSFAFPETAAHVVSAQKRGFGLPLMLTKDSIPLAKVQQRRRAATAGISCPPGQQPDEWPMAMFAEGGAGADVKCINASDNMSAGASVGTQLKGCPQGGKVIVVVI